MSETKRTVDWRECCYCHRNLPITYFPLKPGMKYARYKACRDCHPLGHSCIPKQKPEPKPKRLKVLKPPTPKRRKFATDEERKAAQLEYQRRYREKHRDRKRESTRKSYYRRKGEEPPEEPQKRGPKPKLTEEERIARRREYARRWNDEHREQIREYQRKRYYLRKGIEPPERSKTDEKRAEINENRAESNENRSNPKPKRAKLTEDEKKERRRESQRKWDEKNRDRIREYQRRYYHEHKKKLNARSAERIKQTREKSREEQKPVERFLCIDCNTVKPVGDFITDGKQYKVCNECRARHTKRQELCQKPKSPHGTGERCEYHRQYYQENKEKIKAKRCESSGTPSAVTTDKHIVMLFEKGYSPNDIASRCMVGVERVKHVIEREGCRAGEARLCCDCWLYPCFDGMDSISSNLALTCQKYHRKEAAS